MKFVANLTLVIGQIIGSQNPSKNITSTMVASCCKITLLNCWQYRIFQKYKKLVQKFPVKLSIVHHSLHIKTQILNINLNYTYLLLFSFLFFEDFFVLFCFFLIFYLSVSLATVHCQLLLCFQESTPKYLRKKCFSMTTGECRFLTNILAFTFNISFLKVSLD